MTEKNGDFVSALTASQMLDVAIGTVYNWAKTGKLKSFRKGDRWIFKREDVEQLSKELQPVPFEPEEVTNGPT